MSRPPDPVQAEWLARLRAAAGDRERGLIGWPQVAHWFASVGWVTRRGFPPSVETLRRWRRHHALPIAIAPIGRPWTTTFLLMTWCLLTPAQLLGFRCRPAGGGRRALAIRYTKSGAIRAGLTPADTDHQPAVTRR